MPSDSLNAYVSTYRSPTNEVIYIGNENQTWDLLVHMFVPYQLGPTLIGKRNSFWFFKSIWKVSLLITPYL